MKKTIYYVLLLGTLMITKNIIAQVQYDLCDEIEVKIRKPSKFDPNFVQFQIIISELPNDLKTTNTIVTGGKKGKQGTEYILELFDENDNLIKKNIVKPSEYNSQKDGHYTYIISKNITEYYKVYAKFTRKIYSVVPLWDGNPQPINYMQWVSESFCNSSKVNGGAETSGDRPNLTLKAFKIKKGTKTWDLMKGDKPTLSKDLSKAYEFTITIENNGKVNANNVQAWIGNSTTNKYPDPSIPAYGMYSPDYGSVKVNNSESQTRNVFVYDRLGSSPFLENGRLYYLIVDIDPDGNVKESNENDNIYSFPFYYSKPPSRPTDPVRPTELFNGIATQIQQPYEIQVYDIYGRKILTRKVENEKGEETVINNLSTGYYIFKSENGTRKVAKGL